MVQKRQFDHINEAAVIQDTVHTNIHRGIMFSVGHSAEGVADDGTVELLLQVGSNRSCHARFAVAAGGDFRVQLFEATTFSAAGTPVTPQNRNRFSPTTAETTVTHSPTVEADGTTLVNGIRPGGSGFIFTPGDTAVGFNEWVLKTDTVYLARVQNLAGTAQPLSIQIDFYEPDPDN